MRSTSALIEPVLTSSFPSKLRAPADPLSLRQIEDDIALVKQKWPGITIRPLAAKFMTDEAIAMFEFIEVSGEVKVSAERHYRLVPEGEIKTPISPSTGYPRSACTPRSPNAASSRRSRHVASCTAACSRGTDTTRRSRPCVALTDQPNVAAAPGATARDDARVRHGVVLEELAALWAVESYAASPHALLRGRHMRAVYGPPRRRPLAPASSLASRAVAGPPLKETAPDAAPTRRVLSRRSRGAGATGLEPATSGVTGRRSNRLSYAP